MTNRLRTIAPLLALIMWGTTGIANGQVRADQGFHIQQVGAGTGVGSVQLPPITLGGYLPSDYLNADVISKVSAVADWRKVTRRSALVAGMSGLYTNRVKYSSMSALGGSLSLNASRLLGRKWRPSAGVSSSVSSSDQAAFQSTEGQTVISTASDFNQLSRIVAHPKSRAPNPETAALFFPIQQSVLVGGQAYGNRLVMNSATGGLTFSQSRDFSMYVNGAYISAKSIGSSNEPGIALRFPDSTARIIDGGASYSLSRRVELAVSVIDAQSTGIFESRSQSGLFTVGWTGRHWVTETSVGLALMRGSRLTIRPEDNARIFSDRLDGTYRVRIGYLSRSNAYYAGIGRLPNDSEGFGSLQGTVLNYLASWYWLGRSKWSASANFEGFRTPGNFLYIYTWHTNADFGRQLSPTTRLALEVNYDRHGSKGFEGFHLSRENVLIDVTWSPRSRTAPASASN